jgi:hypothetical protein
MIAAASGNRDLVSVISQRRAELYSAAYALSGVKLPLLLISSIFKVVLAVGPIGQIAIIAAFIALFTRNVMGPHRP